MKKQLKRIRRAAGDARNLDVLAARLEKDYPAWEASRSAKLADFIAHLRRDAQPPIGKLYAHLSENHRFIKRMRHCWLGCEFARPRSRKSRTRFWRSPGMI